VARRRPFGEFDGIDVLRQRLTTPSNEVAVVGIGDDGAVLRRPSGELVVSVDASIEGVHFDLAWLSLTQAAERSFHAAVSDLAAMGADALASVCAIELPPHADRRAFAEIGKGQARAAGLLGCPIVGGNVTKGSGFGFTTTVFGTVPRGRSILRSGAEPGEEVWLSHQAGWAGLGLHLLQQRLATRRGRAWDFAPHLGRWTHAAIRAWTAPRAKLRESATWRRKASALIDTSDSLASEANHVAKASGVLMVLDHALLTSTHRPVTRAAIELGLDPLTVVLYGGEDYALLGTGPEKNRPVGALTVGRVERGRGAVLLVEGKHQPLRPGFDHLQVAR
jgi:thiamine-monophosphate kinase